jgi:glycosyltransferase involved in cell wall biosynthesis
MKFKRIQILGTRGIPAAHGGFETFAEHFSLYLKNKGWDVTVYCQEEGKGPIFQDDWQGIHRIHIPVPWEGAKGTIVFDWLSTLHAAKTKVPVLTLGYNTAIFCSLYRLKGIKNIINMDGIEWRRGKWSFLERTWLYINEKMGAWLGNHLIADHPEIKNHLSQFASPKKITVIPYSAALLKSADVGLLRPLGLKPGQYTILIARPEPENSIIEIVRAYSGKKRKIPLVILGNYNPDSNQYQKAVLDSAGQDILFVGAIYDQPLVQALRFFSRFYIHGHTVGGTNPSLVEALGAGSPVLAHDNKFNRWVAGKNASFFSTETECAERINELLENDEKISTMKGASIKQYARKFTAQHIHGAYEQLLKKYGY